MPQWLEQTIVAFVGAPKITISLIISKFVALIIVSLWLHCIALVLWLLEPLVRGAAGRVTYIAAAGIKLDTYGLLIKDLHTPIRDEVNFASPDGATRNYNTTPYHVRWNSQNSFTASQ
jgi:hypothetical protein